jgi:hypothetical protein
LGEERMIAESVLDLILVFEDAVVVVDCIEDNMAKLENFFGGLIENDGDSFQELVTVPIYVSGVSEALRSKVPEPVNLVLDCNGEHLGMREDFSSRVEGR